MKDAGEIGVVAVIFSLLVILLVGCMASATLIVKAIGQIFQ